MKEQVFIDNSEFAVEFENHLLLDKVKYTAENNVISTSQFDFTFHQEFQALFNKYKEFQNPLIYGKSSICGVVSLEVVDNEVILFFKDGSSKSYPYQRWMLIDKQVDLQCKRLEGNSTFKYIRYFNSKQEEQAFYGRYNKRHQIYKLWNEREAVMALYGIGMFKGLTPNDLTVLAFDIEGAGLTHDSSSEVFLITNSYQKNGEYGAKHFRLDNYPSSKEMIEDWCDWVRELNPDVLDPWNGFGYDLPYLNFVAENRGISLNLGRDGSAITFAKKPSEKRIDGSTSWTFHKAHIFGRHIIDGMFLATTYDILKKYPTWKLKDIAAFEGLHNDYERTFVDASKIAQEWSDPVKREKIVQYGIEDSYDTLKLFYKMIPAYFYTAQSVAKPFEDMLLGATGSWINSILVRGYLQQGYSIPDADPATTVKGGMSYGIPGIYSNMAKIDVRSMYPSIILQYGLYPTKKDPFKYFYQLMEYFTLKRFEYKKKEKETGQASWKALNEAAKVFANSGFGAMGTPGLNFNDYRIANLITAHARNFLKISIKWATGHDVKYWWKEYDETGDEIIL